MSEENKLGYKGDRVEISVDESATPLTIRLVGKIDDADPGVFMDPTLESIHARIVVLGLTEVNADFSGLSFLNSSGIKSLIKWVMRQTELAEHQKYRINFLYSSRVTWQQTSLKALTYLAPKTVSAIPI